MTMARQNLSVCTKVEVSPSAADSAMKWCAYTPSHAMSRITLQKHDQNGDRRGCNLHAGYTELNNDREHLVINSFNSAKQSKELMMTKGNDESPGCEGWIHPSPISALAADRNEW